MAGIVGQDNNYDSPNFVGELFLATPTDTPFTTMIGAFTGGKKAVAPLFTWQGVDLRTAGQNVALEGANAPAPQERVRFPVQNVVEIHHEAIEVSYSRQASSGYIAGGALTLGENPVQDEFAFQAPLRLAEMKRDIEFSFIQGAGTGALPADNTTPRKTKGILNAVATNVVHNNPSSLATPPAVSAAGYVNYIDTICQSAYDNGGLTEGDARTLIVSSTQKRMLTRAYKSIGTYWETTRTIAGLNLQTIENDFGVLNVMLDRFMPTDTVAVVSMDQCTPVFLEIPGKGFLFMEMLAKVGATERAQLYGEVGLEYGNEKCHAKVDGLPTSLTG